MPLVILSVICGLAVLVLLRRSARHGARALAVGAVAAVTGAGASRSTPTSCRQKLTIADAAAPTATLTSVLIVFGIAVVLVLPSIGLLYTLVQRNLVEESRMQTPPAAADDGETKGVAPAPS